MEQFKIVKNLKDEKRYKEAQKKLEELLISKEIIDLDRINILEELIILDGKVGSRESLIKHYNLKLNILIKNKKHVDAWE